MMKRICYGILLFVFCSCGQNSSPDGRSRLRDEEIQVQIDQLKQENKALRDSITEINRKLR